MSTRLSTFKAANLTSSSEILIMDGEDFIICLIITTVIFSYMLFEKKRFLKLWNKCKSTILESYYIKQLLQSQSTRISLLGFRKWEYRGEGNEYLAIALPEEKKILRLRKAPCPVGFTEHVKDWCCHHFQSDFLEELKAAKFEKLNLEYYKILQFLIGEFYVQPSEDVLLISDEINKINKIIATKRPEYRKQKQIAYACGSILTDYAYLPSDWEVSDFDGPTIAVEIKPKQGWIPENERNFPLCTYCLNQYNKLQNNETNSISKYCPMDLFSGQDSRMKFAIKCLLKTPQNNLKIFQDGVLVHGETAEYNLEKVLCNIFQKTVDKSMDEFCDLVSKTLLKQLHTSVHKCILNKHKLSNNEIKKCSSVSNKICDFNRFELPEGCVLDRILNLQELDFLGTKQIYEYFNNQTNSYKQNKYGHAVNLVNRAKKHQPISCPKCFFDKIKKTGDVQLSIEKYLMSAIAKDCSMMITFRKINKKNHAIKNKNVIEIESGLYAFNIGVFDLYPKPISCISKQMRKKNKFNQIYKHISNCNHITCCNT